ncbi:dioxygenase [Aquabacterium sp.]|uniref:dioxygenase family protein n=1 Tax=Aquabacterium sp. TaxID=1872578 RepID=UPI002B543766|nr:class III extradiol ring-cleavage dioxygenase [Aquabacterium sp.]HSW07191.1 class III extradiol ring-cleavage dioxygenase [Aquabacterium sp.]
MDTRTLPPVFLSHGSPMTALEPGAAGDFWRQLGPALDAMAARPRAILAVSAHSLAREPVLMAAARHPTVHDFSGFPDALYRLNYDSAGAPALAERVAGLLREAGVTVHVVDEGGLDHGIWSPLRFTYPQADIPVLPLAFPPDWSPARLFALGEALAPLAAEGVWLMGTGSITHNLRLLFGAAGRPALDAPEIPASAAFRTWFAERSAAADWSALLDYRRQAPQAVLMHPTDEHLLPWFVTAGAGGRSAAPQRIHDSLTYGCLGMDAYAFGSSAPALAAPLTTRAAPA